MMKTLEAMLAIIMIITTFLVAYKSVPTPDIATVNWRYYGFNALQTLDSNGTLAKYIIESNTTALNNSLASLIPAGISYDTTICSTDCSTPSIESNTITSIYYYSAGNATNFVAKKVILYLWS